MTAPGGILIKFSIAARKDRRCSKTCKKIKMNIFQWINARTLKKKHAILFRPSNPRTGFLTTPSDGYGWHTGYSELFAIHSLSPYDSLFIGGVQLGLRRRRADWSHPFQPLSLRGPRLARRWTSEVRSVPTAGDRTTAVWPLWFQRDIAQGTWRTQGTIQRYVFE